jgi:transposase
LGCADISSWRRNSSYQENTKSVVWWDGTGICLFAKRLEEGQFRWPHIADGVMRLSAAQLSALLEGLDFSRVYPRDVARPSATQ